MSRRQNNQDVRTVLVPRPISARLLRELGLHQVEPNAAPARELATASRPPLQRPPYLMRPLRPVRFA
jgi:hypothetical protein